MPFNALTGARTVQVEATGKGAASAMHSGLPKKRLKLQVQTVQLCSMLTRRLWQVKRMQTVLDAHNGQEVRALTVLGDAVVDPRASVRDGQTHASLWSGSGLSHQHPSLCSSTTYYSTA